jgi:hypothetical protein
MSLLRQHDDWDEAISAFDQQRLEASDHVQDEPEFAERQAFLEKHSWPVFRAQLDHRHERHRVQSRLNWTLWFSGMGLAASVAVVLVLLMPPRESALVSQSTAPGIRMKGGATEVTPVNAITPTLTLKLADLSVADGQKIVPGSHIKLLVTSGNYDHVLVFGVEESGALTPYYPESTAGSSLLVGQGRGLPLPDGIQLDDALGVERFVAVFSKQPISWQAVSNRARSVWMNAGQRVKTFGTLGLPDTAEASVWFIKELK